MMDRFCLEKIHIGHSSDSTGRLTCGSGILVSKTFIREINYTNDEPRVNWWGQGGGGFKEGREGTFSLFTFGSLALSSPAEPSLARETTVKKGCHTFWSIQMSTTTAFSNNFK